MNILLNDHWTMLDGADAYPCSVPCSVYQVLTDAKAIPDPYFGENEYISTSISDRDFVFERRFSLPPDLFLMDQAVLRLEGVDTLADIYLNDHLLGHTDNMHRTWEFQIRELIREQDNMLRVILHSPSRYVKEQYDKRPLWGVDSTMKGYPYLRKGHYMFGWDWGPVLPDMGLWRNVSICGYTGGRIMNVYYEQIHQQDQVTISCRADIQTWRDSTAAVLTVTSPDGETLRAPIQDGQAKITIHHPKLWWVRGLGDQPLYTCQVTLLVDGKPTDTCERQIGLRTLTISQVEDEWGKEFCFINNGIRVFAMGANYIPEDQLLPRCTKERTEELLSACLDANYNFIRVWGGGLYPDDAFYHWCDRHGLIIWQDFMFACSAYLLTPDFESTVRQEIIDNVIRLRNHPSLGLWCGNNEIESAWEGWGLPDDPQAKADYLKLFEKIIPETLSQYDPQTFYWPSSPSSGGGFHDSSSNRAGDMHYWAVWHNFKPIEAFRQFYYRFCSEYGFESLPDIKTIRSFAQEKDLDLCCNVMQAHQKCTQGNEKVMYYLAQMVNYPYDFRRLIYCSQLVQADCIRSNVEHMRRARGRCMGSAYWQVNDSNPVISWSSIDYFGRWKGLHYAARRFYAPILLSCDDTDPLHPVLYVTNDTPCDESLRLICRLRSNRADVLKEWNTAVHSPALTAQPCLELDLSDLARTTEQQRTRYLEYTLLKDGAPVSSGTTLFVRPKAFDFIPANIQSKVTKKDDTFSVTLTADCFAKSVCLSFKDYDCVFSDNWFDIHGSQPVTVFTGKIKGGAHLSPADLKEQLIIEHY